MPELRVTTSVIEAGSQECELSSPTLHWLQPDETAEWDAFVANHPHGLVYHFSAWKNVLENAFPHIRGKFLVLRNSADGSIQAGLPVYTVKSWLLGNRIVSVPFASFCDPLVSSAEEFNQLVEQLEQMRHSTGSRVVEIRATKTAEQLVHSPLAMSAGYKHHYLLLDKDPEALFRSFAKSSVCQKVRKASEEGVLVEEREDEGCLEICNSILTQTRARHSLPALPRSFFQAMGKYLRPKHLTVFTASQGGKPVAFHLVLKCGELWISEYSGNTDDATNGVNQLLYWETIKRGQIEGAKVFSFGRTSVSNKGLLEYKRRWNTVEEDLVDFSLPAEDASASREPNTKPKDHSLAYRLVQLMLSKAPLPVSRIVGNYVYRHLG